MNHFACKPIGLIRSPFLEARGTPIQPPMAADVEGTVELFEEYAAGLKDLDEPPHEGLVGVPDK